MITEPDNNSEMVGAEAGGESLLSNNMQEQHMSLASIRVNFQLTSETIQKTYSTVFGQLGVCGAVLESPATANVIVTDDVNRATAFLKDGYTVLQLTGSVFGKGADALEQNPAYAGRFFLVEGMQLVSVLSVLQRIAASLPEATPVQEGLLPEVVTALPQSSRYGQAVLLVDDSFINRQAAEWQFENNSVLGVASYKAAVDAISKTHFDLVLLDLLMPPESFMLSEQAFDKVSGSEFPAGIFVALLAAAHGAKEIYVVTDASHHDHPAVALLDYLWKEQLQVGAQSTIRFVQAQTVQGPNPGSCMKDWVKSIND